MLHYIRVGFPLRHIRRLWMSCDLPDNIFPLVVQCFRLVSLCCSSLQLDLCHITDSLRYAINIAQAASGIVASGRCPSLGVSLAKMHNKGFGKHGKHNGKFGPYTSHNFPQQPAVQSPQGQGFSGMLNNFAAMMGDFRALGEMCQVAQVLQERVSSSRSLCIEI